MSDTHNERRYGRWLVLGVSSERGARKMLCRCDCGTEKSVVLSNLRRGASTSCGCYRKELGWTGRVASPLRPVTYASAHTRLRRAKGPASAHPCVDCAAPALDWSLRHDAKGVLLGVTRAQGVRRYSINWDDYEPRCRKCHQAYDKLTRSGDLPENRAQE